MKVAAIDIGTNTFLCLIAEVKDGVIQSVSADQVEIVRIGEGVHRTRRFSAEAIQRADACLQRFKSLINDHKVAKVLAVATSAARDVQNSELLLELGDKHHIPIQIITGLKESQLTYQGVRSNPSMGKDIVVIDVGGGSTEVIYQDGNQVLGLSFDVGGVRLTEQFVSQHPIQGQELALMRQQAAQQFEDLRVPVGHSAVAVAGTPTTIAALEQGIDYQQTSIEGYSLTLAKIDGWIDRLAAMDLPSRSTLKGLEPKRADIIVAGAIALSEALKAMGLETVTVSTRGVRYGVASELGART